MALNAKKVKNPSNKPQQPVMEAGTYPARLVQLIDLGVQAQEPYQGKEKSPVHMIYTTYEFVDEFMVDEDGNPDETKPRWLSEKFPFYSLEADKAKSTQRYNALDPQCVHDGEWPELIAAPVMVTVGTQTTKSGPNAGKEYNKILSTSSVRAKEASRMAELVNEPKVFLLDDPDIDVFLSLPEWLQKEIKANLDYDQSLLQQRLGGNKKASSTTKKKEEVGEPLGEDDDWN